MAQFTVTFDAEYIPRIQAAFARPSNTMPSVMTPATVDQVREDVRQFIIGKVLAYERTTAIKQAQDGVVPIVGS